MRRGSKGKRRATQSRVDGEGAAGSASGRMDRRTRGRTDGRAVHRWADGRVIRGWIAGRASLGRDGLRAEGAVAGRKGGRALRCRRTPTSGGRWFGFRDLPAPCVSPRVDSPSRPLRRPRGGWRRGSRGSADPRLRRPGTVPGAHLCPSLPSTRCSSRPSPPVGLCSRPPAPPAAPPGRSGQAGRQPGPLPPDPAPAH